MKNKNKKKRINDPAFYNLANDIAKVLDKNNNNKKLNKRDFTKKQKFQVERMMELEDIFKKTINSYKQSDKIYYKFLIYIKIEKGNILMARPFFRENSKTFGRDISPAFKENNIEKIKEFHINYKFILFIIENWKGNIPPRAVEAWKEHQEVRRQIIENSMPLAINEAMKFYKAVPKNHTNLMDIINASVTGLCIGVDKWVGPFRTVFRSVCLSRMKSNIMDVYNQTFLHYYPSDKKIIYKSNLLKIREKIEDSTVLLEAINAYLEENNDKRILENHELQHLLNGSNLESIENQTDEDGFNIYDTYIDENNNLENTIEKFDSLKKILVKCKDLEVIERKIIKLKGVDI
jgi:hypothetical protein